MLSTVAKRPVRLDDGDDPDISELTDFLIESRANQEFYFRNDGFFERKAFRSEHPLSIEQFLKSTLNFTGLNGENTRYYGDKTVKMYRKAIMSEAQNFHPDKVFMGVIWVHYFSYENKKSGCLPVFKVFLELFGRGQRVSFVDSNGKKYMNWNNFRDNVWMPFPALLCIPNNGIYKECNGQLDLLYIAPKHVGLQLHSLPVRQPLFSMESFKEGVIKLKSLAEKGWYSLKREDYEIMLKGVLIIFAFLKTIPLLKGNSLFKIFIVFLKIIVKLTCGNSLVFNSEDRTNLSENSLKNTFLTVVNGLSDKFKDDPNFENYLKTIKQFSQDWQFQGRILGHSC